MVVKYAFATQITYPLFIYFELMTTNENAITSMYNTIKSIWQTYLLSSNFHYSKVDLAKCNVSDLFEKIIIMSNTANKTPLDSLINYNKLLRLEAGQIPLYNYTQNQGTSDSDFTIDADTNAVVISTPEVLTKMLSTPDYLTDYTKENLVLVYNTGNTTLTNYDFSVAMTYGCQFIGINYQSNDTYLTDYLQLFSYQPMLLKSKSLLLPETVQKKMVQQETMVTTATSNQSINSFYKIYENQAVAFLPYLSSTQYLKYNTQNYQLGLSVLPKANSASMNNPYQFAEGDLYIITAGLNGQTNTISFKSLKMPSYYLSASTTIITLSPIETSQTYLDNASFYAFPDPIKETNNVVYYQFATYNNAGVYFRITNNVLVAESYDGQPTFASDIKFQLISVPIVSYYSFRDYMNRYLTVIEGGFVASNATAISNNTKFNILKLTDIKTPITTYAIQTLSASYLSYDGVSKIRSSSTAYGFQLNQSGEQYTITTYPDPLQKTFFSTPTGDLTVEYDGNVLTPATLDSKGDIVKAETTAPTLGNGKYFYMLTTYGITAD